MKRDEFSLIELFTSGFTTKKSPHGPGDDCAVLPASVLNTCVTTDAIVEDVHFSLKHYSYADIGHKALAVNLSDLAAMGATPKWLLCALQLPKNISPVSVNHMAQGMSALAQIHGIKLVGGNISRADKLSLTLTVAGTCTRPVLRSGAQPGDTIYVSGFLGRSAAGLRLLGTTKSKTFSSLLLAQRRPAPHVTLMKSIAHFVSSAIDVSDGFLQDMTHLLKASKVSAQVSGALVPICPLVQLAFPKVATELALRGGEDYVVLFTVAKNQNSAFQRAVEEQALQVFPVGKITAGNGIFIDGKQVKTRAVFSHF